MGYLVRTSRVDHVIPPVSYSGHAERNRKPQVSRPSRPDQLSVPSRVFHFRCSEVNHQRAERTGSKQFAFAAECHTDPAQRAGPIEEPPQPRHVLSMHRRSGFTRWSWSLIDTIYRAHPPPLLVQRSREWASPWGHHARKIRSGRTSYRSQCPAESGVI